MWYIECMDVFETRWFKKWSEKKGISYKDLIDAIDRTAKGLGIVDLGGNVYKIRIAKMGQGRSGGYRTILIYKTKKRSLFIYGFEKSDLDNIDSSTLNDYKRYAKEFLDYSDVEMNRIVENGTIFPLEEL